MSQAGAVLLWETMRVTVLGRCLSDGWPGGGRRGRCTTRARSSDLAAAVALGGDCPFGIAVLWEQPGLTGPVPSDPVVSRMVSQQAGDLPRALKAIRTARVGGRRPSWSPSTWTPPS